MTTSASLEVLMDALVAMDPDKVVSAAPALEAILGWSVEELQARSSDLRRAADLAQSSYQLWEGVCERTALDTAGYSPLGLPAKIDSPGTGALCG
jgi:hypothetical protein